MFRNVGKANNIYLRSSVTGAKGHELGLTRVSPGGAGQTETGVYTRVPRDTKREDRRAL